LHRDVKPGKVMLDAKRRDGQMSFRLPLALDQRLDVLVGRADAVGERTNRREVLAALLFAADMDGEQLGDTIRRYRRATVRDAVLDVPAGKVLDFKRHAPGPRARRQP
jgi:hypothetical protein